MPGRYARWQPRRVGSGTRVLGRKGSTSSKLGTIKNVTNEPVTACTEVQHNDHIAGPVFSPCVH